ncbi:cyclic nucleotide-binding protein [Marinobacter lipolyticus SM19]|uniref:Cyclic nucleotide-binding protein n=1 Tax=Marinobacter lipolyticus SM19 TaxID=1318628 RepID=R8B4R6_9GAMM|nr:Crp/Fnr family transcriptional regulator [Marinobacter lipolyticus]EON93588.1 cyclic nucleotide-binding protein [Marinobacter lipolyticus SM19]
MREIDALEFWQAQGSAYFRELSTFGALTDDVILSLLQGGRVLRIDAGEGLYTVGERSTAFYIVLIGTVNTYMPRSDGGCTLARCHQPGDDMGFVPMIALQDHPASTEAAIDSVVLEITCGQFLELHQQDPDAFGVILLNLVRGMARAIIRIATVLADQDSELHKLYK